MIFVLDVLKHLKTGLKNMRKKVNVMAKKSKIIFKSSSYDDLIMDYYIYKGSKVINCKECGERVLVKSKTCPPKICKICEKEAIRKYDRNRKNNGKTDKN